MPLFLAYLFKLLSNFVFYTFTIVLSHISKARANATFFMINFLEIKHLYFVQYHGNMYTIDETTQL